jgi:hypothetical protein
MSATPADIARRPWQRRASDAWTDESFREVVLTFLDEFLSSHTWAEEWEVVEKFSDTLHTSSPSSINVKVPFGPTGPPNVEDFKQRNGDRLLVLTVVRERDQARFEHGITFTLGSATPQSRVDELLDHARLAFERADRTTP